MRLKKPLPEISEQLTLLLSEGYMKLMIGIQSPNQNTMHLAHEWRTRVYEYLVSAFPTTLEANEFSMAPTANPSLITTGNKIIDSFTGQMRPSLSTLDKILSNRLYSYPELPVSDRLYVEDMEAFH